MHQFNDSVLYVRNGKPIPAIVLKSQETPGGELLTLLYADPDAGPAMVSQSTTRGIAQVQNAVAPLAEGKVFGWKDNNVTLDTLPPSIAIYVKKLEDELAATTEGRDKALQDIANLGMAHPSAPEQLDEAQGAVEPGYAGPPLAIPNIETADYRPSLLSDGSEAVVNPPAL